MYFATLAYFLCWVYIIPEGLLGEGFKSGMFTISPQEAEHGSLPLPHAQLARSDYWIIVQKFLQFFSESSSGLYGAKSKKHHGTLLLVFVFY